MPRAANPNEKKTQANPGRTKSVDLDARTVDHLISTPTVDEQGEVLLPRGADISRFMKTGTVFDTHMYNSQNVVGKCLKYKIEDDGHHGVTRFAERPPTLGKDAVWHPDVLLHLYSTGDVSGWSIGFNPAEWREPTKKDDEAFGSDCRLVHTKYRVLEYSVAPLPCNEDALTRSLQARGIISKRLADCLKTGKLPKLEDLRTKRIIVAMNPAPTPVRKTIVLPPPAIQVAPKVDPERVAKRALAVLRGKLYAD